jgi:hypothetical protein
MGTYDTSELEDSDVIELALNSVVTDGARRGQIAPQLVKLTATKSSLDKQAKQLSSGDKDDPISAAVTKMAASAVEEVITSLVTG